MQYFKLFCFKNYRKFATHNLENLCPWCLASIIPVLGLERVCSRKVGPWPWSRNFFESLALTSKVVPLTTPLHHTIIITQLLILCHYGLTVSGFILTAYRQ